MATQGGPAKPVTVQTGGRVQGGPAQPIAIVTDGRAVEAGPSTPIYIVTSGPVLGGPAMPVVAAAAGRAVRGGPAIPAYVVSGSFSSVFTYTNKVIALSPIDYFPQADAVGATVMTDESGNGRNGAYKAAGEPLLGQVGIGDGRTAALYDGSNDYANAYTAGMAGAFNGAEGTIAFWFKASAAGVWTDAILRRLAQFRVDANNRAYLERSATNNVIAANYVAGGIAKTINYTTAGPTTWQHYAMTWSKSGDQFIAYVNGVQQGATATGLGVWAGSLSSTLCTLGAADTSGTNPWSGSLAHAAVWASALSAAQVATLAVIS